MARLIVSFRGRLMCNFITSPTSYSRCFQRLPTPWLANSINMATNGFQGHPLQVRQGTNSWQTQRNFTVYNSVQPGTPPPTPPPSGGSSLGKWILGILITVIVPFFTSKWTKFLKYKDEVETVVEETEKIIERVEDVAETVDKVAKNVADHLPEGGKLKNAAEFVEDVAEEIAKDAHLVENLVHEVEKVEDKVELMVEKINHKSKDDNEDSN